MFGLQKIAVCLCSFFLIISMCFTPLQLAAETEAPAADPKTVQVTLAGFTVVSKTDESGQPVLDDAGEPVILRIPLDESVVTPGETVLYVIALNNRTDDPATDLALTAKITADVLLDPYSFTAPDELIVAWADRDSPDQFKPLFEEIEGEEVMQADLDTLSALRLTLPELAPAAQSSIEYTVTLR